MNIQLSTSNYPHNQYPYTRSSESAASADDYDASSEIMISIQNLKGNPYDS
jgi:hypothetical protein